MSVFRMLIGPDAGADAAQLALRTIILFAFGILCIRIAGRRTFARYTPLDIIVALIVGSNISRAMTGNAAFWPAVTATLVLVLLHRLLAHASRHLGFLSVLVKARPLRIIEDGELDEAAMRRAEMSRPDVLEALRMKQVEHVSDVRLAVLEPGGKMSVVRRKK